jgi:transcriptional regulator with XRE-family HTH domain
VRPRSWINNPAHDDLVHVLKVAREASRLTQRDLAARLKTEQSTIARIETGQRAITLLEFVAICRALEIDVLTTFKEVLDRLPSDLGV